MTYVYSLENDLCGQLGSGHINDGPRILVWVKESIRVKIYVYGEVGGRETKHDDCQDCHHDGCARPLPPRAVEKTRKLLDPVPRMIKCTASREP